MLLQYDRERTGHLIRMNMLNAIVPDEELDIQLNTITGFHNSIKTQMCRVQTAKKVCF